MKQEQLSEVKCTGKEQGKDRESQNTGEDWPDSVSAFVKPVVANFDHDRKTERKAEALHHRKCDGLSVSKNSISCGEVKVRLVKLNVISRSISEISAEGI